MGQYPEHIQRNIDADNSTYSLYEMSNVEKCKINSGYLGDVIIANEDLIWHSVHKYVGKPEVITANYRVEKDDILQLGRLGFYKAVMAFDTGRGVKFSSFAVTAIVREIKCYLRDSANIFRPTRTANELIQRISRIETDLGFLPSITALSEMLDEPKERIKKAVQVGKNVKYLDENIKQAPSVAAAIGTVTFLDLLEDKAQVESDVLDKVLVDTVIESIKDRLTEEEVRVLRTRIEGYNQTQTAEKERISQMKVSRIMKKVAALITDMDHLIKGE
jgi:RNA polymerase sporulation-specific sigma factor